MPSGLREDRGPDRAESAGSPSHCDAPLAAAAAAPRLVAYPTRLLSACYRPRDGNGGGSRGVLTTLWSLVRGQARAVCVIHPADDRCELPWPAPTKLIINPRHAFSLRHREFRGTTRLVVTFSVSVGVEEPWIGGAAPCRAMLLPVKPARLFCFPGRRSLVPAAAMGGYCAGGRPPPPFAADSATCC